MYIQLSLLYPSCRKDKYLDAELSITRVVISTMTQRAIEKDGQTESREDAVTIKLDYVAVVNSARERDAGNVRLPAGAIISSLID